MTHHLPQGRTSLGSPNSNWGPGSKCPRETMKDISFTSPHVLKAALWSFCLWANYNNVFYFKNSTVPPGCSEIKCSSEPLLVLRCWVSPRASSMCVCGATRGLWEALGSATRFPQQDMETVAIHADGTTVTLPFSLLPLFPVHQSLSWCLSVDARRSGVWQGSFNPEYNSHTQLFFLLGKALHMFAFWKKMKVW